jgi:hypothetical protein
MGDIRSWAVERLYTPKDLIKDSLIYETPFFTSWKMGDAKQFSKMRKSLYKSSRPASSFIRDYVSPIIRLHKTKKPNLPWLAKVINDQTESKLIVNHMLTSGKFTYGLTGIDLYRSLSLCSRARNPYEAYATGGYTVETVWRSEPLISYESQFLLEHMLANVSLMSRYVIPRFAIFDLSDEDKFTKFSFIKKEKRKQGELKKEILSLPNKRVKESRFIRISLDDVNRNDKDIRRDTILCPNVTNILADIQNRQLDLVDIDEEQFSDLDENLYLTEEDGME